MHEHPGNRGVIPASTLLVAIMVVGGVYLSEPTLKTLRPIEPDAFQYSFLESESIQVPAWEDPWVAINKERHAWLKHKQGDPSPAAYALLNDLRKQVYYKTQGLAPKAGSIQDEQSRQDPLARTIDTSAEPAEAISPPAPGSVEIMVVMTTAGGQHSAIETRRRQRYSLMAAMAATGYQQTSPRNVGHLVIPRLYVDEREKTGVVRLDAEFGSVAFDWFQSSAHANGNASRALPDHVLVLWVQSDMLQRHAFLKLANLLSAIWQPGPKAGVSISILGPDDSTLLKKLIDESQGISQDVAELARACETPELPTDNLIFKLAQVSAHAVSYPNPRGLVNVSDGAEPKWVNVWDAWQLESEKQSAQESTERQTPGSPFISEVVSTTFSFAEFYLDDGIPRAQRDKFSNCLLFEADVDPDTLSCLNGLNITDSDSNWSEMFADMIDQGREALVLANGLDRAELNKDRVAQLIWVADEYLDKNIVRNEQLKGCLESKEQGDERELVKECVSGLAIEDIDDDWPRTVGELIDDVPALPQLSGSDESNSVPASRNACAIVDVMKQFSVWSPRATIPLDQLVAAETQASATQQQTWCSTMNRAVADLLAVGDFNAMIADDRAVLTKIKEELDSRGIDLCAAPPPGATTNEEQVAILLDSTSYYGSQIPGILRGMCNGQRPSVRYWGYVQRVDGAGDPGSNAASKADNDVGRLLTASSATMPLAELPIRELSAGPHQLDYARRLGEQVVRDIRESGSDGVRAVGVLGPDIYDKLLIFQGIRNAAPGVLLFTTDLDAAYSHPNAREWASNLVIGSAFGLEPPERRLGGQPSANLSAPPFRDAYQTAFYRASRRALLRHGQDHELLSTSNAGDEPTVTATPVAAADTSNADSPLVLPNIVTPVLFEVGRRGFVELTTLPTPLCTLEDTSSPAAKCTSRQAGWTALETSFNYWLKLVLLSLPITLMMLKALSARREALRRVELRKKVAEESEGQNDTLLAAYEKEATWSTITGVFLAAVCSLLLIYMATAHSPDREPFLLFDGVSGVPTIVMWSNVIALSIAFALVARVRFSSSNREMNEYFKLNYAGAERGPGWLLPLHCWIAPWAATVKVARSPMHALRPLPERLASAQTVWRDYRVLGSWQARAIRVTLLTLVWFFLVLCILDRQPMQALVRGIDQDIIWSIRAFTILGVLFIIAMAGDAMKLCKVFIRAISLDPLQWEHTPDRDLTRGLDKYVANRVTSMEVVARRTETIGQIIFYPFLLVGLLLIARSSLFEGWVLNGDLLLIYGFFVLYLFVHMIGMQREADAARSRIISNLRRYQYKVRMQVASGEADLPLARRALKQGARDIDENLERLIDYVESIRRGAFQPVLQHPMFQAIAWPSTGIGIIALLQLLL